MPAREAGALPRRLKPLASVARASLFEVRGVRFTHSPYWHTSVIHRPSQGLKWDLLCVCVGSVVSGLLRGAHVYAKPTKSSINEQIIRYNKLRESSGMLIKIIQDAGSVPNHTSVCRIVQI